jgi:hypothetical protein
MKNILACFLFVAAVVTACQPAKIRVRNTGEPVASYDSTDRTNDFYDNEPIVDLPGSQVIEISGEVEKQVSVKVANLPLRNIIVKETRIEEGGIKFTGAYRYDGISLYDLLNQVKVVKKNAGEFKPIIDQYVVVFNAAGDSVVFSWGELYYPVQFHQVIIASRVVRIVPSKTRDKWPLPEKARLIVGSDLITERNIPDPVKIVIRSLDIKYKVDRSIKLWAPEMVIHGIGNESISLKELPSGLQIHQFEHVFYGRGKGIHGVSMTSGAYLKDLLIAGLPPDRNLIRNGLFSVAGIDGYRCSMTYSELMNRNDNAEVMIMDENNYEGAGKFSCLFTADFFSDRAIKSISEIRLMQGFSR